MRYDAEVYYFYDQRDFPFEKAVLVTAMKVSEWCTHYKAELTGPAKVVMERHGSLPLETQEKQTFVDGLVRWVLANSYPDDFALILDDVEIDQQKGEITHFHHDHGTCCWVLDLTEQQFQELQKSWKRHKLPEDLFYQEGQQTIIALPTGAILKEHDYTGIPCVTYTPKRWEEKQRKESAAKGKNNC